MGRWLCPHIYSIQLFGLKFTDELGIPSNVYSSYKRINNYYYYKCHSIHSFSRIFLFFSVVAGLWFHPPTIWFCCSSPPVSRPCFYNEKSSDGAWKTFWMKLPASPPITLAVARLANYGRIDGHGVKRVSVNQWITTSSITQSGYFTTNVGRTISCDWLLLCRPLEVAISWLALLIRYPTSL